MIQAAQRDVQVFPLPRANEPHEYVDRRWYAGDSTVVPGRKGGLLSARRIVPSHTAGREVEGSSEDLRYVDLMVVCRIVDRGRFVPVGRQIGCVWPSEIVHSCE